MPSFPGSCSNSLQDIAGRKDKRVFRLASIRAENRTPPANLAEIVGANNGIENGKSPKAAVAQG